MLVASHKELRVGCDERWNEHLWVSFSYQWEGLKDFKILAFTLSEVIISLSLIEIRYTILLDPILCVQLSDLILSKDILYVIFDMKRIESKERLEAIACTKHDLLGASRMRLDKVRDVIHSVPECDPNPVLKAFMLLQVVLSVYWPNSRLGLFAFRFLTQSIQVSKQCCSTCSI